MQEKYKIEEIFCQNSKATRKVIIGYIQRHNLLEYKCSSCGNDGYWLNKDLSLELHHIDGDSQNNELSNLTYLCPNCHALTKNFRGKNKVKEFQSPIPDEQFVEALKNSANIRQALISLQLQPAGANYDKAKKLIQEYGIEFIDSTSAKKKEPTSYCLICGSPVYRSDFKYCSQECSQKAQQRVERPSREELKQLIRTKPFLQIGAQYSVSDNAIRKWCKAMGLPSKKTEINKYSDEEWARI